MPTFSYAGLNAQGKELRGQIEAVDLGEARAALRRQGLRILELVAGDARQRSLLQLGSYLLHQFKAGLSVRNADLTMFYRQMQLMLRAGHTIVEALEVSARLASRPRLARALERCSARISGGKSFSAALSQERAIFPQIAVKLAEAGEASGELDLVFERLSALTERRSDIRRQLITALTYPAIVTLASIGVITFLVGSVVPRFAVFLQSRGKSVPWAAQTMMDMAEWLQRWGFVLAVAFAALIVGNFLLQRIPRVRLVSDRFLLRLPVLGSTMMAAAMAQVAWTFGLMLRSGLTVLEALRSVSQIAGNQALARALQLAAEQVLEGRAMAVALARDPIPSLVQHMAAIGERSGEIESVMEALGNHYQKELDSRVKLLSTLIEPVLTLVIGGIVGFVYYAFFQAVLAVSTGGG
ncbi:type II secretion system F family protein [Rhodocyclus tenuis]|uniref:General secretion pathway protein F n=1 Tax=Rhodocyclus tenuis TaxID=1066 RepID=A0A840GA35_RHOTE|nr:type II secretion system F family protein [Rhodocyclus tenuis]MBB4248706.1 type IV pilus assembly protein PilC [Rhodocyclus tenuis]MBK1680879.1 hypothetical protein [Rhodocyclus tenuis]